jgi:hypothetical protein
MTTLAKKLKITKELKNAIRTGYAWPGGYALFTVMNDGGCLCMGCTRRNWQGIAHDTIKGWRTGWDAAGVDAMCNVDGDLTCDNCSKEIG